MTRPDNQKWEDILPRGSGAEKSAEKGAEKGAEKTSPFALSRSVDGYAFTQDPESPELRYRREPRAEVPAPPRREPPQRMRDQLPVVGVWQPGGPAHTEEPDGRMARPGVALSLLSGLIPVALIVGGIYLVMHLYGFR